MSAYALFFRDTQAAIKGQNPNATFGDVSKIVASMWDSLGEEQKQVNSLSTLPLKVSMFVFLDDVMLFFFFFWKENISALFFVQFCFVLFYFFIY